MSLTNSINFSSGVSAAGTTSATATVISAIAFYSQISTCAVGGTAGVSLPVAPYLDQPYNIRNDGLGNCRVYPPTGGQINGMTADLPFYLSPLSSVEFIAYSPLVWYSYCYNGAKPVRSITAAATYLSADSGSIISFDPTAGAYAITLPAPTVAGLEFIVVQGVASAAHTVNVDCGVGLLVGGWLNATAGALTGATTAGTGARNFNFLSGASVKGDQARFVSNGTNWFVQGLGGAAVCFSIS